MNARIAVDFNRRIVKPGELPPPDLMPLTLPDGDAGFDRADRYLKAAYDISLAALLAPADIRSGASEDLRGSPVYRQIQDARRAEDPRLPLGPWERELKRADWPLVARLSVQALAQRSKDLQLAAWLMEAGLQYHGFVALAPGLALLRALCLSHWNDLYPLIKDNDVEYRTNIFRWIDSKFPNLIAMIPVTSPHLGNDGLTLGDWRAANRPDEQGRREDKNQTAFLATLTATSSRHLIEQTNNLRAARDELEQLDACLDNLCGNESPGFAGLACVLDEVETLLRNELEQRGETIDAALSNQPAQLSQQRSASLTADVALDGDGHPYADAPPFRAGADHGLSGAGINPSTRQQAYALLGQAAECLLQTDPHSPVPYLVRQAIAWGRMDTSALYEELFLKQGGQINVFQLLGLKPSDAPAN
jgi:type VI secretion system protein ImpA